MSILGIETSLRNVRRIRHIDRIIWRNVELPGNPSPISSYYTLSLVKGETYHTSPVAECTLNPFWDSIPSTVYTENSKLPLQSAFVLRIYRVDDSKLEYRKSSSTTNEAPFITTGVLPATPSSSDTKLVEIVVNVFQLEKIHSRNWRTLPQFPVNTLLYFFPDGIYAHKDVLTFLKQSRTQVVEEDDEPPVKKIDVNSILNYAAKIANLQTRLAESEEETRKVCLKITERTEHISRKIATKEKAHRLDDLKKLQETVRLEEEALDKERKRVQKLRREMIPRAKRMAEQNEILIKQRDRLNQERQRLIQAKKTAFADLDKKVHIRRRKILMQLTNLYPIIEKPTGKNSVVYTIRGIPLKTKLLANQTEEYTSTALGYVCHLVSMLSKHLQVPLRYRVIYKASRSSIGDDAQDTNPFPLYAKNSDENAFDWAILLLNKNIELLLDVRVSNWHEKAQHSQNTLENLAILLEHELPK